MKLNKKALVLACCGILSIGLIGCKNNTNLESSSPGTEHSNTNNNAKDSEGVNISGNKNNDGINSSDDVSNDVNSNTNNPSGTNNKKEHKKGTNTDVVDKNATKNNDTSDDSSQYTQDEIKNMFDYEDGRGEEDR